jgi:hypothetical protein
VTTGLATLDLEEFLKLQNFRFAAKITLAIHTHLVIRQDANNLLCFPPEIMAEMAYQLPVPSDGKRRDTHRKWMIYANSSFAVSLAVDFIANEGDTATSTLAMRSGLYWGVQVVFIFNDRRRRGNSSGGSRQGGRCSNRERFLVIATLLNSGDRDWGRCSSLLLLLRGARCWL